jgi:hypothetical protein
MADLLQSLRAAIVRVGGGRGFVVVDPGETWRRYVVTAAHCLPRYPRPNVNWDSTFKDLLGPLSRRRPTVWAECLFVDPVADLAVLQMPDSQELTAEADVYDTLIDAAAPLPIAGPEQLPDMVYMLGRDPAKLIAGKLRDPEFVRLSLWVTATNGYVQGGMSGSPIVAPDGAAIGVVSISGGVGDLETHVEAGPSPWLAARLPRWLADPLPPQPVGATRPVRSTWGAAGFRPTVLHQPAAFPVRAHEGRGEHTARGARFESSCLFGI